MRWQTYSAAGAVALSLSTAGCGGSSPTSSGSSSSSNGGPSAGSYPSGASGTLGIAVSGDKLISTQTGSVVQLLGVSASGFEQGGTSFANGVENYGNPTDPGFAAMASWNMNLVRIPLNEDTWLGVHNCTDDGGNSSTLQSNLKQAIANANAAGLYVILDLHWSAPNSFGCPEGQGSMPDEDNTVAFWSSIAAAFKGNPAVIQRAIRGERLCQLDRANQFAGARRAVRIGLEHPSQRRHVWQRLYVRMQQRLQPHRGRSIHCAGHSALSDGGLSSDRECDPRHRSHQRHSGEPDWMGRSNSDVAGGAAA
jgi:hypothetical protein